VHNISQSQSDGNESERKSKDLEEWYVRKERVNRAERAANVKGLIDAVRVSVGTKRTRTDRDYLLWL
jgi:hypothetical protein